MIKALIIIDMWDKYLPGHDRFTSSLEQLSLRLASLMGRINSPIVVASYNTPNPTPDSKNPWSTTNQTILDGLVNYTNNEDQHKNALNSNYLVSWDRDEVIKFLNSHNVTDLYFAGTSFPGCVLSRPLGMWKMQSDFNCHVVIDCVLNALSSKYTEYDIIHDTYHNVLASGLSYIHSTELTTND
ncbi:MAG: isochorismatase family protein [Rhodobacteraceae bacterium]|nr:isochorismatase family protein [Paracoccaceae bacterium]